MLTAGIAVLTGTILACFQPQSIDIYWLSLLPICLFLIRFHPSGRLLWLLLTSFLWCSLHIVLQLDQRPDQSLNHKKISLSGEVLNIPKHIRDSARFIVKPVASEHMDQLPGRIRLTWKKPPKSLKAGQIWSLTIKIKPAHGFQNPGGFDYERWLFTKGIHATGYVVDSASAHKVSDKTLSINRSRQAINRWIEKQCADCQFIGLLQALSTGYRGNIEAEERLLLQTTGTAHLIAISGLHIGIIAGFVYLISSRLWSLLFYRGPLNQKDFALIMSWLAALVYSLLSGFELPAQRAFLMLSVLFVLYLLRLPVNPLNSVMTTLIVVLIFSPLAVLSESFWLTLSALFIILIGSVVFKGEASRLRQMLRIQLLFSLLFIPLTMLIFNQVHSASLLANVIAVPVISLFVVPFNFILLSLFWLPSSWLSLAYELLDNSLLLLIEYLQLLEQIGLQAIDVVPQNIWQLLLILVFSLLLIAPRGLIPLRTWILFLPLVLLWPRSQASEEILKVTVLDVGMGLAIVVRTLHHSLVFDFGPGNRQGYSLGQWVVVPYLRHQGLDTVDKIVISHADQDHAGGLHAVYGQFQKVAMFSGTPKALRQSFPQIARVQDCHTTKPWIWDGVAFEFLTASTDFADSKNNRSCVLSIRLQDQHILLTGDIEAVQEKVLIDRHANKLTASILVAPHHGSETSSSPEFVEAVSAEHVIFSSGFLNHWRFPRAPVVERYRQQGANIYRTDTDGAIQIECSAQSCKVEKFRQANPRIWY